MLSFGVPTTNESAPTSLPPVTKTTVYISPFCAEAGTVNWPFCSPSVNEVISSVLETTFPFLSLHSIWVGSGDNWVPLKSIWATSPGLAGLVVLL